jgi:hypothetical protein
LHDLAGKFAVDLSLARLVAALHPLKIERHGQ